MLLDKPAQIPFEVEVSEESLWERNGDEETKGNQNGPRGRRRTLFFCRKALTAGPIAQPQVEPWKYKVSNHQTSLGCGYNNKILLPSILELALAGLICMDAG